MKKGFTLAEVLITLGIIGIVAAMTIPILMQNAQEKSTVTALRKAMGAASQAYIAAVSENGEMHTWSDPANTIANAFDVLTPYFQRIKICKPSQDSSCWPNVTYKRLSGANWVNISTTYPLTFSLPDGSIMGFAASAANVNSPITCTRDRNLSSLICLDLYVDVNGHRGPNTQGIDFFCLHLMKSGAIIPSGTEKDTGDTWSTCNTTNGTGWGCAAWVIYNQNMDYLHCNGLSWSGPTKCN